MRERGGVMAALVGLAVVVGCDQDRDVAPGASEAVASEALVSEAALAREAPVALHADPKRSMVCPRDSASYQVFPMQVCEPIHVPPDTTGTLAPATKSTARSTQKVPGRICQTKGGPWLAVVIEEPLCTNIHVNDYRLTIYGPQTLEFAWTGKLEQGPAGINWLLFSTWSPFQCNCCPGYLSCGKNVCKAVQLGCGSGPQL